MSPGSYAHGQDTVEAIRAAGQVLLGTEYAADRELSVPTEDTSEAIPAICASLKGLWAFSMPPRILLWRVRWAWLAGPILSGALPLVINGLLMLIYGRLALHTADAWVWLAVFALAQAGALITARALWGRVVRDMPLIVDMLPDEDADHKLAAWIRAWCSARWQAAAAVALSGLGAFVLWRAWPDVSPHLELGPVSYIAVAWTSFMGGLVLYVLALAILLSMEISYCGPLNLDPWDPANTPGLRTLSRGYIYCLAILIVLAGALETVATRVPGYHNSEVLRAFVIGFPIFAVLCGLSVMLVPHLIIAHLTYLQKERTRDFIDEEIGDIGESIESDHGRLVTLVWLRNHVFTTPALPIRMPWLLPLVAALVGPLLAFLLTLKL